MPATTLFNFHQASFLQSWTYRDTNKTRNVVINEGTCTVFSVYFLKLAMSGAKIDEINDAFLKNIDAIVETQEAGKKVHAKNRTGYDEVTKRVGGFKPPGAFVPPQSLGNNQSWIHVFQTKNEAHTIAHIRFNDNYVYTFDPNVGLFKVPLPEWDKWLAHAVTTTYQGKNDAFLQLVKA